MATFGWVEAAITSRHIRCDGAFNIRDLGGYATVDGGTTVWGSLYRADGLHRITVAAGEGLLDLGWRTVLDLRTVAEVEAGAYRHAGADVIHLPVLREVWDAELIAAEHEAVDFLVERYVEMLDEGATAIATAIEILAVPDRRPAVFHCSAGKDRTGVLAALVLSLIGVPDDVIAQDYALSALAMDKLVGWYRENHPELVDHMVRQPTQMLDCPAEAMLVFLERLRAEHGSVTGYLLAAGTARIAMDELRTALVER